MAFSILPAAAPKDSVHSIPVVILNQIPDEAVDSNVDGLSGILESAGTVLTSIETPDDLKSLAGPIILLGGNDPLDLKPLLKPDGSAVLSITIGVDSVFCLPIYDLPALPQYIQFQTSDSQQPTVDVTLIATFRKLDGPRRK